MRTVETCRATLQKIQPTDSTAAQLNEALRLLDEMEP